jgi:uncharacterized protein YbaP (TraB family)
MLATGSSAWPQSPANTAPAPEISTLAEVVVTGEQPGPKLWKATRNDHVLWILGTVTPKPRDITWRSKQVAAVLDDTQEVIDQQLQGTTWPTNISIEPEMSGPLQGLRALMRANKVRRAHVPPPLVEVVPPDLYARFAKLKAKYMPRNKDIELQRPRVAANTLYAEAIDDAGLSASAMIHDVVHKLARKRNIKISAVTLVVKPDSATAETIYTEFNEIPPAAELPCFEATIQQLETELPIITARANAWAIGDLKTLRNLPPMTREVCDTVRWSAPRWSDLHARLETLWLDTIDAAVAKNAATLVLIDMSDLLQPDGLLASLPARGYQIDEPQ